MVRFDFIIPYGIKLKNKVGEIDPYDPIKIKSYKNNKCLTFVFNFAMFIS